MAVGVGEGDGVLVGVACDAELALVVQAVVVWAQGDEVPGVGGATVLPVDDVVYFQHVAVGAAGHSAVLVAQDDEAAGAFGDDAPGASDRDRYRIVDEGGGDQSVASDVAGDGVGEASASVVGGGAVGVEVDVDPEPVAAGEVGDGVQ